MQWPSGVCGDGTAIRIGHRLLARHRLPREYSRLDLNRVDLKEIPDYVRISASGCRTALAGVQATA